MLHFDNLILLNWTFESHWSITFNYFKSGSMSILCYLLAFCILGLVFNMTGNWLIVLSVWPKSTPSGVNLIWGQTTCSFWSATWSWGPCTDSAEGRCDDHSCQSQGKAIDVKPLAISSFFNGSCNWCGEWGWEGWSSRWASIPSGCCGSNAWSMWIGRSRVSWLVSLIFSPVIFV